MKHETSTDPGPVYARGFQGSEAVARYFRKLDNRIDVLRDRQERDILGARLAGDLFDCTIGVGRFVGRLPAVSSYAGMDLSTEFVAFVREQHPDMAVQVGDLTQGIVQPDDCYDSVLCLRSLSAIGHLESILREMVRVARPGGVIAFDYGRSPRAGFRMRGEEVKIDAEDLEAAIDSVDAEVLERIRVDGILARLKARLRLFRFLNGRYGRCIPDPLLVACERMMAPFFWQRELVFLRKRGRTA